MILHARRTRIGVDEYREGGASWRLAVPAEAEATAKSCRRANRGARSMGAGRHQEYSLASASA